MKCQEFQELLAAYAEGLLDEGETREVEEHIESCAACQKIHEENMVLHEQLLESGRRQESSGFENEVMKRIFREQAHALRERKVGVSFGRIAATLAAAAAVIAMAVVGFHILDRKKPASNEAAVQPEVVIDLYGPQIDDWRLYKGNPQALHLNPSEFVYQSPSKLPRKLETRSSITAQELRALDSLGYGGGGGVAVRNSVVEHKATFTGVTTGGGIFIRSSNTIGFSTGGAKDIANFRENIENGFLPLPTDVTPEGLFYDYFFDTHGAYLSEELFYPGYSMAVTKDPFSKKVEYYLTVGLNSGLKSFERKPLNLVIVLDVSGSMKENFNTYHYDQTGNRVWNTGDQKGVKPKIEVAKESLLALLDHLRPEDRFGMAVFSDQARLAKPFRHIGGTDMERVREHIRVLGANGSTNLSAGLELGASLYDTLSGAEREGYENRIVVITDAMPNQGDLNSKGLLGKMKANADQCVYTTFVGIGVDFNSELVEAISKTRGANYYSAHSSEAFRKRMVDEFEFMVTPLVFDLKLNLESGGFRIEKVFGSPEAEAATGTLMKVNTLFPSPKVEGRTKGGVVLLKLEKKPDPDDGEIFLSVEYEDRDGLAHRSSCTVTFPGGEAEHFDHSGVRKAVLLARYATLLKGWLTHARLMEDKAMAQLVDPGRYLVTGDTGLIWNTDPDPALGPWERKSLELKVSDAYRNLFFVFKDYFEKEKQAIGDESLEQEVEVLERLLRDEG